MDHFTRVLSKDEEFPSLEELAQVLEGDHSGFKLVVEEGGEAAWETLLLLSEDEVEVALVQRMAVWAGSSGEDEIADLWEDCRDCKPESGVAWLRAYLDTVRTVYVFEPLQGADMVDGSNALHALRSALFERGDAILQADDEGFTNEEGFHIVWQFSDSVSGPWNMGVYQDDVWHHFKMDLGDPAHRAAFLEGEVPDDLTEIRNSRD